MSYNWYNCPQDIKDFVNKILHKTNEIIQDNFVGLYLHGSLAMGGFNPACSDIDILIVTNEPIEVEMKRKLGLIFLMYSKSPYPMEVSLINRLQLHQYEHPYPYDFHFSEYWRNRYEADLSLETYEFLNGKVGRDPDLAAHITIINERGICIEGNSIEEVFPIVPKSSYISSILGDFNDCLEDILENPVYCTLNLIRVYVYLKTGIILSKEEAGIWGKKNLSKEMIKTIKKVVNNYSYNKEAISFEKEELLFIREYFNIKIGDLLK